MSEKYNIILHTTTSCNYKCTYCDVIKDNKYLSQGSIHSLVNFINTNTEHINRFKFFWWEPLLAWQNIKYIINNTADSLWNKFEIVTNTTLLNDEIWEYFSKYFKIIFFSIDSEHDFDFNTVFKFIGDYHLNDSVYFNLIISPWKEEFAYSQFEKIYKRGHKNFNILPVYFTKPWDKNNLKNLSFIMSKILDMSIFDNKLKLYWFCENNWEVVSLINNSLFIDVDLWVYYSDIVSNNIWKKIKNDLYISRVQDMNFESLNKIDFSNYIKSIKYIEEENYKNVSWQRQLHKIMDYFSKYLKVKNGL